MTENHDDDFPADFTPEMRVAATNLLRMLEAMTADQRKYTLALLRQKYRKLKAVPPQET